MRQMTFQGPGDEIAIDGLAIKRGETVEVDELQIRRLIEAGANLEEAKSAKPDKPAKGV